MPWIDWAVVGSFLVSMLLVGVCFSYRAGENVDSLPVRMR